MHLPAFVLTVWTFCTATPARAMLSLGVIGFITNVVVRYFTSKAWADWCAKHPRIVGLFLIVKGAFPEGGTMLRGLLAAFTGELRERAKLPKGGAP